LKYLDGCGDGTDDIRNKRHDLLHALGEEREVVVVDPEFAHEEEGSAEEFLALCRANVQYISDYCSPHSSTGRQAS
jgi:hypothetical protein